jgi:hypothetical protein
MQAAFSTETEPPDAIHVGELPLPATGPTDVLVKVQVTVVNLLAARWLGRSQHLRSKWKGCGASACLSAGTRAIRIDRPLLGRA